MNTITTAQRESLETKIYDLLMSSTYFDAEGEETERGMGEMGETKDEAVRVIKEWMEETNITESQILSQ